MISDIIKETKKLGILLQQAEQQITEAGELLKMAKEKHTEISDLLKDSDIKPVVDNNFYLVPKITLNESSSSAYFRAPKTTNGRF